jgi:protein-tyrosine-phosphatase
MPEPLKVLFVCTANICRSPYLELTARALSGDDSGVRFSSAGTHGFDSHTMDDVMAATLAPLARDTSSGFASRRLTGAILADADLVLTAESAHRSFILEEFPQHLRKVFTVGQFAAAVEEHPDLNGRELVAAVGARRTAARPEHDIADPYRRGEAAATTAADTMSSMLGVVVPRLATGDSGG